jgi:hypothetical protein
MRFGTQWCDDLQFDRDSVLRALLRMLSASMPSK